MVVVGMDCLPQEILEKILLVASPRDFLQQSLVCKRFNSTLRQPLVRLQWALDRYRRNLHDTLLFLIANRWLDSIVILFKYFGKDISQSIKDDAMIYTLVHNCCCSSSCSAVSDTGNARNTSEYLRALEILRLLFINGANPDFLNGFPLRHACLKGDLTVARLILVEFEADPCGQQGQVFKNAARQGHVHILQFLFQQCQLTNDHFCQYAQSALGQASARNQLDTVEWLLSHCRHLSGRNGEMSKLLQIQWELVSYTDSEFTNPHDLVSHQPSQDGRGKFTHLGVQMEGLESRRHLNFCSTHQPVGAVNAVIRPQFQSESHGDNQQSIQDESCWFWKDPRLGQPCSANLVVLRTADGRPYDISRLEFDTSYFTRNNVRLIYSVHLLDLPDLSLVQPATLEDYGRSHSDALERLLTKNSLAVSRLSLSGDSRRLVELERPFRANTVILRCTEGGLTRFHSWGRPVTHDTTRNERLLSAGSQVFGVSDASYGDPTLVLRPEREGRIMAGWESCRHSKRHRLGLILPGEGDIIDRLEIDTFMHCLNSFRFVCVLAATSEFGDIENLRLPPWRVQQFATSNNDRRSDVVLDDRLVEDGQVNDIKEDVADEDILIRYSLALDKLDSSVADAWQLLLPMTRLQRDTLHVFTVANGLRQLRYPCVKYLMFFGIPDGGVHRIGVYGLDDSISFTL